MRLFLLFAVGVMLAGCGSVPERVAQRFAPPVAQERIYDLPEAAAFTAAQQTLTQLGYQVTKAAPAQGLLEAQSRLLPTERFGSSDQYVMTVRTRSLDGGAASVSVVLFEQSEGQFRAGATSMPLREHGRYASFFEMLEQLMGLPESVE